MYKRVSAILVSLAMVLALIAVPMIAGAASAPAPTPGVDQTAALQNAIDTNTDGILDLGGNTYVVSSLNVTKPLVIKNGTLDAAGTGLMLGAVMIKSSNVALSGLTINGAASANCINIGPGISDITIDTCDINAGIYDNNYNDTGDGILTTFLPAQPTTNVVINNCTFTGVVPADPAVDNSSLYPIYMNPGLTGFTISNNTFKPGYCWAVQIDSADGKVVGNTFDQSASFAGGMWYSVPDGFIVLTNNGGKDPSVVVDGNTFIADPTRDPDTDPQYAVIIGSKATSDACLTDFSGNKISGLMPDSTGMYPILHGLYKPGMIGSTAPNDLVYALNEDGTGYFDPTVTVTFVSNGGRSIAPVPVSKGTTITAPTPAPTKAGFIFAGWYAEGATTPFDFANTPITGDLTLYARWTPSGGGTDQSPDETKPPVTPINPAKGLPGTFDSTTLPIATILGLLMAGTAAVALRRRSALMLGSE